MTAARNLTDADLERLADILERRRLTKPRRTVVASETDMELARKLARQLGWRVVEPKGKR